MFSLSTLALSAVASALLFALPVQSLAVPSVSPYFSFDFCNPVVLPGDNQWYRNAADSTPPAVSSLSSDGLHEGVLQLHGGNYLDLITNGLDTIVLESSFTVDVTIRYLSLPGNFAPVFDAGYGTSTTLGNPSIYNGNIYFGQFYAQPNLIAKLDGNDNAYIGNGAPLADQSWARLTVSYDNELQQITVWENNALGSAITGISNPISYGSSVTTTHSSGPKRFTAFLGRSMYNGIDTGVNGEVDTFAIYSGVYTPQQLQYGQYGFAGSSCTLPVIGGGGAKGDPQFTGFMGQSFQVHGASDAMYNILTTPHLSYNAHFSYLESGECRKGTPCFSHPGNYFSEVALVIRDEITSAVSTLQVIAGPVKQGMTVTINDEAVSLNEAIIIGMYTLVRNSVFDLSVESSEFNIRISNSDMFLNQDVSIGQGIMTQISEYKKLTKSGDVNAAAEIEAKLPHGILGQTWSTRTYNNRWKHIQGQLFNYQLDSLNSTTFKYSRF